MRGLNELDVGSAVLPFKPESQKTDRTRYAETDTDDEDEQRLILVCPFTGSVRLRRVVVACSGGGDLSLFKNVDVDLDSVERTSATQTFG